MSNSLDKFYTEPALAQKLVERLAVNYNFSKSTLMLEPSAGAGAFYKPLKKSGFKVLGLDIEPSCQGVKKTDFLEFDFDGIDGNVVAIGNPPFGFAATTAVRFFNKAAEKAEIIAFIVPRTFRKISVKEKLNKYFHLVIDEDIPYRSFIKDGEPHGVPCAWQVWERRKHPRRMKSAPDISHLLRFTDRKQADYAMRRVGGRAGAVLPISEAISESSNYYIKEMRKGVKKHLESIDWNKIRNSTAGQRSISKKEIAFALEKLAAR